MRARMVDIIQRKRNGKALSEQEISFFIDNYTKGNIPDYQASSFLMAVYFQGMNAREVAIFTKKMMHSGDVIDLSGVPGTKVDKHSTGGVGDKTSLIIAPLVSAAGVPVPMISGRALGHTGGTLDKLESIPGFSVNLSPEEFESQISSIGVAMIGQTGDFVPADKKLYSLRDVTGTVESIPLITASIMSKKMAEGADAVVIDVKVGNGAFMTSVEQAENLAHSLVSIGNEMGCKVAAVVTDMNQPLGNYVGNSLEVIESINCLRGNCSLDSDLMKVVFALSMHMLLLGGIADTQEEANSILVDTLESGKALEKFRQLISAQNGNPKIIEDESLLPLAKNIYELASSEEGFVVSYDTKSIGIASMLLGAGRRTYKDEIDNSVGLIVKKKIGDRVDRDETVFVIYYNDEKKLKDAVEILKASFVVNQQQPQSPQLIHKAVTI